MIHWISASHGDAELIYLSEDPLMQGLWEYFLSCAPRVGDRWGGGGSDGFARTKFETSDGPCVVHDMCGILP